MNWERNAELHDLYLQQQRIIDLLEAILLEVKLKHGGEVQSTRAGSEDGGTTPRRTSPTN